jgi:hypothetical protein
MYDRAIRSDDMTTVYFQSVVSLILAFYLVVIGRGRGPPGDKS